ncbi:MAG: transporter substrate-binding domain-containing protein [Bacteroidota bacterium]
MKRTLIILVFLYAILPFSQAKTATGGQRLKVGIVFAPPYVIYNDTTNLSGVCIDLWNQINDSLHVNYEYKFYTSIDTMCLDLHKGIIDFTVNPFTATNDRLERFRFSIPFYISNMGIASRVERQNPMMGLFQKMISWKVIRPLLLILFIATFFAIFLWLAERKKNSKQFRHGALGVVDGIWWAFVTMTTVGYGDKIPKTGLGRVLAILWMFFAIGMFFIVSGVVSSELTVTQLQSQVKNTEDLSRCKVGAVYKTGYAETLSKHHIRYVTFNSCWDGLTAVSSGLTDAFVYDEAILKYLVSTYDLSDKIVIIPAGLNIQYFSFMCNKSNPELIDRINPAILNVIDSDGWGRILRKYGIDPH